MPETRGNSEKQNVACFGVAMVPLATAIGPQFRPEPEEGCTAANPTAGCAGSQGTAQRVRKRTPRKPGGSDSEIQ